MSSRLAQSGERQPPILPDRHGTRVRTTQPGGRRKRQELCQHRTVFQGEAARPPFFHGRGLLSLGLRSAALDHLGRVGMHQHLRPRELGLDRRLDLIAQTMGLGQA